MFRHIFRPALLAACVVMVALRSSSAEERFAIHEWGTFTVLQDEQGSAIAGVNINDEPLPDFVYRLPQVPILAAYRSPPTPFVMLAKSVPAGLPTVTMRLETPVIYVYPPKSDTVSPLDIRVRFQGGLISEWFPDAELSVDGENVLATDAMRSAAMLKSSTVGEIKWSGLKLATDAGKLPQTKEHVWITPRNVSAPKIETPRGNVEHYLFYRGVAHLDAPLRVIQNEKTRQLTILKNASRDSNLGNLAFTAMWLVDVRQDGKVAFQRLQSREVSGDDRSAIASASFDFGPDAYAAGNLDSLRSSMKSELIAAGLFSDEADAMLNTWQLSYFKSPGLRLFFNVPRAWTDRVLPLETSRPADVERVMIGRIELVSPWQRKLLQQIAESRVSKPDWYWNHYLTLSPEKKDAVEFATRENPQAFAKLGFPVPPEYQAFLDLGRFREALVRDALSRNESPRLREFAKNYAIVRDEMQPTPVAGNN